MLLSINTPVVANSDGTRPEVKMHHAHHSTYMNTSHICSVLICQSVGGAINPIIQKRLHTGNCAGSFYSMTRLRCFWKNTGTKIVTLIHFFFFFSFVEIICKARPTSP